MGRWLNGVWGLYSEGCGVWLWWWFGFNLFVDWYVVYNVLGDLDGVFELFCKDLMWWKGVGGGGVIVWGV